jgi:hypothetical protein
MGIDLSLEEDRVESGRSLDKLSVSKHLGGGRKKQIQLRGTRRNIQKECRQQFLRCPLWEDIAAGCWRKCRHPC